MQQRENQARWEAEKNRGWVLSVVSTAVLILFMFLYLLMTTLSSNKLAEQTSIISEHPFEVVIATGELNKNVTEMRNFLERLTVHNGPEDVASVRSMLEAVYREMEAPMTQIEEQYLGEAEDVDALTDILAEIRAAQTACLDYSGRGKVSTSEMEQYQAEHLTPLYERAYAALGTVTDFAKERKVAYGEMAEDLRGRTQVGSGVLLVLMIGALLVFQAVMYRQRRELARRASLFDNLSETIGDAFFIWDAATREVDYVALNLEPLLGHPVRTLEDTYQGFAAEDVDHFKEKLSAYETNFDAPFERVVQYRRPDGEARWISLQVYKTKERSSHQFISVFSDCTDDVRSRQALQEAMESAERANAAKSDFLSRMSHEIRTPLNAVIGMTTIAATSVHDPAKVEDCLTKINFSSKHLLMLINDVLDMSKIESNKMILQEESFDLFQLLNTFVSTNFPLAKAKGIEFEELLESFGEQTQYLGDPLRLNQILSNLASNALKFTPAGGKVTLRCAKIASRGNMDIIRFVVEDTGIGMTKEELERIYTPFEQANASISGRFGGTGLGMSITKNLVQLMSGALKVESEPGVGTVCTVELPFQRDDPAAPQPSFEGLGLCALVVDDEQAVCEQTAALLENIRITAQWVLTGEEAVREVVGANRRGEDFDFCLIDWKIPDMDGLEITRRIRASVGWGLPIVMISAYDYAEIETEARLAGVNAFLPKPLYRSSVYAAVKAALEQGGLAGPAVDAAGPVDALLRGRRLLVAEDNELNREILTTLLEMRGVETECAFNGQEAVERFLASPPGYFDAILMDVQMPVMGGHEAAETIRGADRPDARSIPIVATTANAFHEDVAAALGAGMDAHISKPIDMEELCRLLGGLLKPRTGEAAQTQGPSSD